jgi:multidrug resistance protein, MATE family
MNQVPASEQTTSERPSWGGVPVLIPLAALAFCWASIWLDLVPRAIALAASFFVIISVLLIGLKTSWLDKKLSWRLTRLGAPVVVAMITQNIVNIVDTYVVGKLPGHLALPGIAALGLSLPLLWLVGGFLSSSIAIGTQAITARRHAQGNDEEAGRTLMSGAGLAAILGIVFTAAGSWLLPSFLPFLNDDRAVIEQGLPFARIRFLGIIAMVVTAVYKAFFDGIGRTRVHMYAAIVMNIVNAVLCWGLVLGEFGMPRLEVEGAAWAASVSSVFGMLFMIGYSLQPSLIKQFHLYRSKSFSWLTASAIFRLSLPSGVAVVIGMSGFLLFLKAAAAVDAADAIEAPVAATATAVILQIILLIILIAYAFATPTATLVSQSIGAKDPWLAHRFALESVKIGILIMACFGSVLFFYPHEILGVFMKSGEAELAKDLVVAAGEWPLRLMAAAALLIAPAFVFTQSLYGAGNTKFVMVVEGILHLSCLVPLSWLFGVWLEGGLLGIWAAAALYVLLLAAIMGWKFAEGSWKHITL